MQKMNPPLTSYELQNYKQGHKKAVQVLWAPLHADPQNTNKQAFTETTDSDTAG